jgi:hypothetical protein
LTKVLEAHLKDGGREVASEAPVLREDGTEGIVDLMLSRRIPQPRAEEREHLVIELKRPTVEIDGTAMLQIQSYALAVADDERFRDTKTRWVFWAVSNKVQDSVRKTARQRNRPDGLFYEDEEQRITIWVKTWGQLIQECKARLEFFQKQLNYAADSESALAYLRVAHEKYLPKVLTKERPGPTTDSTSPPTTDVAL